LIDEPYTQQDFIDAQETVDVWEENWDVLHLFMRNATQWRMSMAGPYALDMTIFHHELDRKKVPDEDYDEMLWKLGIIEPAALKKLNKRT
jgi:Phage related hypothetical protein (DUF1799).